MKYTRINRRGKKFNSRLMSDFQYRLKSGGRYNSLEKDRHTDILCASIQTIGRARHLDTFPPGHFDYIVVDEFHHAAAGTYRRLLGHFKPRFLLGLTATPDRTDHADILSFCDDNLVFTCSLFQGVTSGNLVPFHYYGILDETVDYKAIPWRNSRFDPEHLSNALATLNRAGHAHRKWLELAGERTLAFCISIRHADYMADEFNRRGISSASVHGKSGPTMATGGALFMIWVTSRAPRSIAFPVTALFSVSWKPPR